MKSEIKVNLSSFRMLCKPALHKSNKSTNQFETKSKNRLIESINSVLVLVLYKYWVRLMKYKNRNFD